MDPVVHVLGQILVFADDVVGLSYCCGGGSVCDSV